MTAARPALRLDITSRPLLALTALVAVVLAACSPATASRGPAAERLRVVATTTVFADIVGAIGGDHVEVDSIVPAGSGPEDYEPRPEDAREISEADLIVSNGVGLDDFLTGIIDAAGSATAERLVLGDGIPTITMDGEENPHFWLDPSLVQRYYVPAIRGTLARLVPSAKGDIEASATAYAASIRELDEASRTKLAAIPAERRKLVTFHDAFPYFAEHYDFELVGVILENPGQEPSAADLAALVAAVKEAGVTAVFSEAQFDPKLARTLADEAGITRVVTTLYNDSLGPPPADTYIGLMTWDVDEIVKALR
jgi:zinc/manganese transport system substrate-binding protein/manganese/iron transport system substrate-binding protein